LCAIPIYPQEAPELVLRAGANLVLLDVAVTESRGNPVPRLTAEAFTIRENGQPKPIAHFQYGVSNLAIALAVDNSGSMAPRWGAVQRSVGALLANMQTGDEGTLLVFHDAAQVLIPLEKSVSPEAWTNTLGLHPPMGRTSLYDAVIRSSRALQDSNHDRRVIVVLSDGKDTSSHASFKDALNELRSSNRILYAVGLFKPGEPDTDAGVLRKLAEETGGIALFAPETSGLVAVFEEILSDLRTRYLVGYYAAEPAGMASEIRKLAVEVRDENGRRLKVRSRRDYRIARQ
jgi:Ca-activated chloride channel family protein